MPFTSIPTRADGDILSAAHLNLLSDNQEYLFGLTQAANIPFNSYSGVHSVMNSTHALWYLRHRLRYFHFKVSTADASNNDYIRIFYNGVKIAANEAPGATYSGVFDLTSWAGVPNLLGAWVTATAYDEDELGDGEVVSQSGAYYRCIASHTSGASTQPGVGASWATVWEVLTLPFVGGMCSTWIEAAKSPGDTITVDYLIETDAPSL